MVRTQIYLTESQRDRLAAMAKSAGKKQSELIREAVDRLLDSTEKGARREGLRSLAGLWQQREDLPDFQEIRSSWDRT